MDKILELGDVFGLGTHNLNWTFLVPVAMVFCAVAVFMFGFKKAEGPKFRKLVSANSSSSAGSSAKRKKRNAVDTVTTSTGVSAKAAKLAAQPQKVAPKNEMTTPKKTPEKKQHASKSASGSTPTKMAKGNSVKGASGSNNMKITALDKRHESENGGGEWKTVITKKQKKQTDLSIAGAAAGLAEVDIKHAKNTGQSPNKKQKDSPKAVASHKKPETVEAVAAVAVEAVAAVAAETIEAPAVVAVTVEQQLPVKTGQQQQPALTKEVEATIVAETKLHSPAVDTQANNLAFDELGDAGTESKQQKKNKKRPLKEH